MWKWSFLVPLLEEGFNIQGFDASESMLKKLHTKANNKNIKPNIWQGFIEDLNRVEKYSLIFIPSGSFCLIIDIEAMKCTLKVLFSHIKDNGILLFEIDTVKSLPPLNIWQGYVYHKVDGSMIISNQLTSFSHNICSSIGKYELVNQNKVISTEVEQLKVYIHNPNNLTDILYECGFKSVRTIKAFDIHSKPDEDDETIVFECIK